MADPPDVSDREVLTVFEESGGPLQARDVADDLPIAVEDTSDRIDDLRERGLLVAAMEAPGDAFRLAPDATGETLPDEQVETDTEAQAGAVTGAESSPRDQETPTDPPPEPSADPESDPYEPPADAVAAFDPPGTPEQKEFRRAALRRAYEYLRERGRASRNEFEADVFSEAPGGYEYPDDEWWKRVVQPGLAQLPGAEPVGDGDEWEYVGDTPTSAGSEGSAGRQDGEGGGVESGSDEDESGEENEELAD